MRIYWVEIPVFCGMMGTIMIGGQGYPGRFLFGEVQGWQQQSETGRTRMAPTALHLIGIRKRSWRPRVSVASAASQWTRICDILTRCPHALTISSPLPREDTQATWITCSLPIGRAIARNRTSYCGGTRKPRMTAHYRTVFSHSHVIGRRTEAAKGAYLPPRGISDLPRSYWEYFSLRSAF